MKLILASIFLFCSWGYAAAQSSAESHPIDDRLTTCIDNDPTTVGMCECAMKAQEEWDAELNKYYQKLKGVLDANGQTALRDAQRKWLEYRDLEFKLAEAYIGNMEGTMYRIILADKKMAIVKARALELKDYYEIGVEE